MGPTCQGDPQTVQETHLRAPNNGALTVCLRYLHTWNKTLSLKLVWLLYSETQSLWAEWTKKHQLKGDSIWSMDDKKQSSWIWSSILKLRPMAEHFWYDYWLPIGPLIKYFGDTGPRHIGGPLNAKFIECCTQNGWSLRPARSSKAEHLQVLLCSVPLPSSSSTPDVYKWYVNDNYLDSFSTNKTWDCVRCRGSRVERESTIWFSGHIPKHAFNMWVANHNRLQTRCRLAAWDITTVRTCLLCNLYDENRNHHFLRCSFSEQVWAVIIRRLGYRPFYFHNWTSLIAWLNARDTTSHLTLRRFAAQATIYLIWIERNNRFHQGLSSTRLVSAKTLTNSSGTLS
ncbi:hypothetical protein N665_2016s0003 [Sinapis alba]|nr:hypothetical protein N665_2016s0003 [Sinapis alba]